MAKVNVFGRYEELPNGDRLHVSADGRGRADANVEQFDEHSGELVGRLQLGKVTTRTWGRAFRSAHRLLTKAEAA